MGQNLGWFGFEIWSALSQRETGEHQTLHRLPEHIDLADTSTAPSTPSTAGTIAPSWRIVISRASVEQKRPAHHVDHQHDALATSWATNRQWQIPISQSHDQTVCLQSSQQPTVPQSNISATSHQPIQSNHRTTSHHPAILTQWFSQRPRASKHQSTSTTQDNDTENSQSASPDGHSMSDHHLRHPSTRQQAIHCFASLRPLQMPSTNKHHQR